MTCAVIGAGPAGLSAAWELRRLGHSPVVIEKDDVVGGLSRTVVHDAFRFDIGGHRFFTKVPEVQALWEEMLGEDFLVRDRLSRILYGGQYFDYPLRPLDALRRLGLVESARVVLSYLGSQIAPPREERSFEDWVTRRFGARLFEIFFKTYSEKVWGVPCSQIAADWAAQRIRNVDLAAMLRNALFGPGDGPVAATLIDRFHYPRLGPGMMWERLCERLGEAGVDTLLGARVVRVSHAGGRVRGVEVRRSDGDKQWLDVDHVISSMPLRALAHRLDPAPPPEVLEAASALRHRAFISIGLVVARAHVFPDNWLYVHTPSVRMGRVQNFKNWSPAMVPDAEHSSLGLEYFVDEGDELWRLSDAELVELGSRECESLGLARRDEIEGGVVIRMPHAYPVYDHGYRARIDRIRAWLGGLENLQSVGRNGQHRYNNQDHSMLTGLLAARNVAGAHHDIWAVNVDPAYHEADAGRGAPGSAPIEDVEELLRQVFARYDPVALGTAVACVAAAGLFLVTVLGLTAGSPVLPKLSLLDNYLFGYTPSWPGAAVAGFEGAIGGFGFGHVLASAINAVIGSYEIGLRRRLELMRGLDGAAD